MGFLGNQASSFADGTLIIQTAGFLSLLMAFIYAKRKNFLKHDKTTKTSVFLGALSLIWMSYSLVSNLLSLISITSVDLIIVLHTVIGSLAMFTGSFMIFGEIKKTKTSMIIAFFSWTAAMFLGVILYFMLFK